MFYCPYCDTALTRVALLALRLEKVTQAQHKEAGHGGTWLQCQLDPCLTTRHYLQKAGLDKEEKF